MRILLVYPDILPSVRNYKGYMHTGLSSIAACLIDAGHKVKLINIVSESQKAGVAGSIKEFSPDIVGISSTTNQFEITLEVARTVREVASSAKIVVGGVHAILNPDQVMEHEEVDLVCRGEGEMAMLSLAAMLEQGLPIDDAKGCSVRLEDGSIQVNELLPLITDLDALPYPSRSVWDYKNLHMESAGIATVMFSRGCPRKCTYCCNYAISSIYREAGSHQYFRQRSVKSTIDELLWLKKGNPFITAFNFDDDNLFLNLQWATDFAREYKEKVGLPFSCNIYPGQVDETRVELLRQAGCKDLRIGLESGNEYIRSEVLGRQTSDSQIRNGYRLCREAGINTRSFVMVGLPFETPEMVLDSIRILADEKIGVANYSIFYPYRKTALYDVCVENNFLKEGASGGSDYFSGSILEMESMSGSQIKMFRRFFPFLLLLYRLSNGLPGPMAAVSRKVLDTVLPAKYLYVFLFPVVALIPVVQYLMPLGLKAKIFRNTHDRELGQDTTGKPA